MSKLVSYDSGDESASENSATEGKDFLTKDECIKEKSLQDEWDSFNQMISGGQTRDTLVSYPAMSVKSTSDQICSSRSNKTDQPSDHEKDGAKSSSLYDPLDHSSDDDDDDDDEDNNDTNKDNDDDDGDVKMPNTNIESPKEMPAAYSQSMKEEEGKEERRFRENVDRPSSSSDSKSIDKKDEDKPHKRSRRDNSSEDSQRSKKRRLSPTHKKSMRDRSRSRDKQRKSYKSRDGSSSRSRRKHRSGKSSRRSRSRSRSKHHDRRRHERHRSSSSSRGKKSRMSGPRKNSNQKNFKEQLKAMFLQNQNTEDYEASSGEKKASLPLNSSAMAVGGSKPTSQQAMAQTMAAMHAKVQEMTGVAVPKYYNPAAINPIKYAEQLKKRKLLWSKNKEVEKEVEVPVKSQAQWSNTSFVSDQDGKMAAKFRKLMGIKGDERLAGDEDMSKLTEEQRKKQEELFHQLAKEYDFARMTTHSCRGVGLGFASHTLPQP